MARSAKSSVCRREGFSLLELLIVVVILSILATIVVISINSGGSSNEPRALAFVQEVTRAAEMFKGENNGRYPGQDDIGLLKGSAPDGGPYTGSQILASKLFGYTHADIASDAPKATSKYLEYKSHLLINKASSGRGIPKNSLADNSQSPNALLYFPSRLNVTAPSECYKWDDNSIYISKDAASARREFDEKCITDSKFTAPNNTRNPGGILIIGTGANDMYLESKDNDDIKSWDTD